MTKHIISSFTAACLFFSAAYANEVSVEIRAGGLAGEISSPENVTSLILKGQADASDFAFIASQMPNLEVLDLSGVTEIAANNEVFLGNTNLHAANQIPSNTFSGMKLTKVVLPNGIQGLEIGYGAFAGTPVATIDIPGSVSIVGDGAFAGCYELKSMTCSAENVGTGAFADCPALETVRFTRTAAIPESCFYNCVSLKVFNAPGILSVGDRAFSGCSALKSFEFGKNLTSIGREAFMQSGLESVDLVGCPLLKSVGDWAFAKMPDVKSIKMGHVAEMGEAIAFSCPSLTTFKVSESATELPDFALSKSASAGADGLLPESIETIGRYAMSGMGAIEEITLPESISLIGDHAMENMSGLKKMTVNMTVLPELGEDVWAGIVQGNVEVNVPADMYYDYVEAEQWKEFNIVKPTDNAEDVIGETLPQLRGRFEGDNLIVQSVGVEIDRLVLYNPAGQLLVAVEPTADTVEVDTNGFGTRIFIIHAALADGRNAVLKLSK